MSATTVFRPPLFIDDMVEYAEIPSPEDPAAAMAAVVALRRLADRLERAAVANAIAQGWTWAKVGQGLEVSPQAPCAGARSARSSSRSTATSDRISVSAAVAVCSMIGRTSRASTGHDKLDFVFGASPGSPPERRRCRRPRLASDPWQTCCPSCS